jgi:deoxyribodipyrimidine photo-lyase
MGVQAVWFKRDLRITDHAPLLRAAQSGPLLCFYVLEPGLWAQPDSSRQHFHFVLEALRDLYKRLRSHGVRLHILVGEATEVLEQVHKETAFTDLHSHEETGNDWTFGRDKAVATWCKSRQVNWHEVPQFGVVRGLKDRSQWQRAWQRHMAAPMSASLADVLIDPIALHEPQRPLPSADTLGLAVAEPSQRQRGGETVARDVFLDFLAERSQRYRGGISSPLRAPDACSRLSTYITWGCLSLREVVQATRLVASDTHLAAAHRKGLKAFASRLAWHCHFIQKLESEPAIEWRNMHRGYDDLRELDFDPALFDALKRAQTGWPLVDACIRMLNETGWLNFRMRAMLVSVAAYPLWLHWRPVGLWLAQQFLDYEPGIHWSQLQMQSGTTGINTTRVYNPVKQAQDQDPDGVFVRHWLPAMRRVPDTWLFEPWKMPASVQAACGVTVGKDIPMPIVDLTLATRRAKDRLHARRKQPDVRAAKAAVIEKHASRRQTSWLNTA